MGYVEAVDVSTFNILALVSSLASLAGFYVRTPAVSAAAALLCFVTAWTAGIVATVEDGVATYLPPYTVFIIVYSALGLLSVVSAIIKVFTRGEKA